MGPIDLPATDKTPSVLFDPSRGVLEIRGCSIHENSDRFFRPLLDQVEAYAQRPVKSTVVRVALSYFNSSSAKYVLDLLKLLDEAHASGHGKVVLEWYYDEDDLDMQEAGNDYRMLLEMPVKMIRN